MLMPPPSPAARRLFAVFLVLVLPLLAEGCASRPGPETLDTVQALPAGARSIEVLAVTTRGRTRPDRNVFDAAKSRDAQYAALTVSIPPGHKRAQIEWPKKRPDAKKTFAVVAQSVIDRQGFEARITAARLESPRVGVFVHGYNYNFQEALFRAAQLSADANIEGAPVLFSWPSQGAIAGYVADKEAATYSRDYLADLLISLSKDRAPGDVYVFAHSMGGWLVVETLRQLKLSGRDDVLAKLTVVLASPDIDADVFNAQMRVVGKLPRPMTILVSGDDRALQVSKFLNASRQRIGSLDAKDPLVRQAALEAGVQIIDISALAAGDQTNHNRFADVAELYPALSANASRADLGQAGAFVFDAAGRTISSPFRIVSGVLTQ